MKLMVQIYELGKTFQSQKLNNYFKIITEYFFPFTYCIISHLQTILKMIFVVKTPYLKTKYQISVSVVKNGNLLSNSTVRDSSVIEKFDNLAPNKTKIVKYNSKEQFHVELAEAIVSRDKLFKQFKYSKLRVDKKNYKKARYEVKKVSS